MVRKSMDLVPVFCFCVCVLQRLTDIPLTVSLVGATLSNKK